MMCSGVSLEGVGNNVSRGMIVAHLGEYKTRLTDPLTLLPPRVPKGMMFVRAVMFPSAHLHN